METEVCVWGCTEVKDRFIPGWMVDLPVVDGFDEVEAILQSKIDGGRPQVLCLLLFVPRKPSKGVNPFTLGLTYTLAPIGVNFITLHVNTEDIVCTLRSH
jgi:hypothetical protein